MAYGEVEKSDTLVAQLNTSLGQKTLEETAEVVKQQELSEQKVTAQNGRKGIKDVLKAIKYKKAEIIIPICYLLTIANLFFAGMYYIKTFLTLNTEETIFTNPWYVIISSLVPFLIWVFSTSCAEYNFHQIKMITFSYCLINWEFMILVSFQRCIIMLLSSLFLSLPTNGMLKPRVLILAIYAVTAIVTILPYIAIARKLLKNAYEPLTKNAIIHFRIVRLLPQSRKEKKFGYSLCVVRNLKTGKKYVISEADRRLHFKGLGSTGGGKTATINTVAFEHDLIQKVKNTDYQKRIVEKWLKAGKVQLKTNFEDKDYTIDNIAPNDDLKDSKEYKKMLKKINDLKYTAKIAGHTVMCPNAAYADELYALAKAKGIKINRIDPVPDEKTGEPKEDWIGSNPIYVPIKEGEVFRDYFIRVFRAARLYSDVNQAIYETKGQSNPYFTGLNKNLTVAVSIVVIIGHPLIYPGEYATMEDVQKIMHKFERVKLYRDAVVNKYGKRNEAGVVISDNGSANVGTDLQVVIDVIDVNFLGTNKDKIYEQAEGLRNIIDEPLMNPNVKMILCAKKTIDMDKALDQGELTIVNFEISLGSDSVELGQFFMLSFINAVLRRPGTLKTRLPHFFCIDEAPMLFHPRIEICTTLFRQYNTSMMLFMQSLSQYDKSNFTKYLKNVLTGNCAHQMIFGRASLEEMEYYSKLSGLRQEIEETEQIRETSITDENTNQTFSHSSDVVDKANVSAEDVRYREFLECTVLSVQNSTPLPPFLGKTNFLPRGYNPHMKRYHVDWNKYYKESKKAEEIENVEVSLSVKANTEVKSSSSSVEKKGKNPVSPVAEEAEVQQEKEQESSQKAEPMRNQVSAQTEVKSSSTALFSSGKKHTTTPEEKLSSQEEQTPEQTASAEDITEDDDEGVTF